MLGLRLVALLLAGLLSVTACSDSSDGTPSAGSGPEDAVGAETGPPVVNGYPLVTDPHELRLPVQGYLPSAEFDRDFATAVHLLDSACLRRFGFEPAAGPPSPWSAADAEVGSFVARRYSSRYDEGTVREYGYQVERWPAFVETGARLEARAAAARRERRADPALVATRTQVETGVDERERPIETFRGRRLPEGGCVGQAMRRLTGSARPERVSPLAEQINFESFDIATADPRVVDVFGLWSQCLAREGFDYATPRDASADPRFLDHLPADAVEIETALADLRCTRETNLIGVWHGVEVEIQEQMIELHAAELAEVADGLAERDRRIRDVLGAS